MDEMSNLTEFIESYMLHDPVGNVEGMIANFDQKYLQEAEDSGMVIIAVYNTGRREITKAKDVKEPQPSANGIKLVAPPYVDKRTQAVVDVFDALAASVPAVAASAEVQPYAEGARSSMSFAQALEALRKLAYPDSEEGGAQ